LIGALSDIHQRVWQITQIGELDMAATQPNKRCARRVFAGLDAQEVDAIGGSLGGMDAVKAKGRRLPGAGRSRPVYLRTIRGSLRLSAYRRWEAGGKLQPDSHSAFCAMMRGHGVSAQIC
jgi:hypothetical protein